MNTAPARRDARQRAGEALTEHWRRCPAWKADEPYAECERLADIEINAQDGERYGWPRRMQAQRQA